MHVPVMTALLGSIGSVNLGAIIPSVLVPVSSAWTTTSATYRYLNDLDPTTGAAMATLSPPQYGARGFATSRIEYGWLGQFGTNEAVAAALAGSGPTTAAMPAVAAAPVIQWISPAATDTISQGSVKVQVQAFAAAADGILGGVPSVDFWVNDSAAVNVAQMTPGTIQIYGGTRQLPLFEAIIPFIEGAVIDIYARANVTPEMAALGMQPRVIGPMRVYCQAAYDAEVNLFAPGSTNPAATNLNPPSFTPGANYDNLPAVLNGIAKWTSWKPTGSQVRIKAVEDMNQDVGGTLNSGVVKLAFANNISTTNSRRGRVTIDGNGFNMLLSSSRWMNAVPAGQTNNMAFLYNGLTLTNLKIDNTRMGTWLAYQNETLVNLLDNVEIYGSGMTEMPGADGTQMCPRSSAFWTSSTLVQMTRCYIHDMSAGDLQIPMRIGTRLRNQAGDAVALGSVEGRNPRSPFQIVADDMDNVSSFKNTSPTLVMSLTYNGTGATYAIRGTAALPGKASDPASSARTLVLRLNGQDVPGASFSGNYPGSTTGIQSISDLAAAINAWSAASAGGAWTATPLGDPSVYNHLRATFICTQRFVNGATPPTNQQWYLKTGLPDDVTKPDVPLGVGIWTGVAQHPDLLQFIGQDNLDNVLYSSVYATNFNTQGLTIQLQNKIPTYKASNIALVQNAYNSDTNAPDFKTFNGYIGGNLNHCMIVHNTSPSGNSFLINCISVDFLFDQFCRIDSNYNEYCTFKTGDGSAGTPAVVPVTNFSSQILGQIRRNRSLHNFSTNGQTWDFISLFGDATSNNVIMDPSVTGPSFGANPYSNTLAILDYPAIAHGTFIDGVQATFTIADFTPSKSGGSLLRQTANLVKPQIPFDIAGRPRLGLDLAGPVSLVA